MPFSADPTANAATVQAFDSTTAKLNGIMSNYTQSFGAIQGAQSEAVTAMKQTMSTTVYDRMVEIMNVFTRLGTGLDDSNKATLRAAQAGTDATQHYRNSIA